MACARWIEAGALLQNRARGEVGDVGRLPVRRDRDRHGLWDTKTRKPENRAMQGFSATMTRSIPRDDAPVPMARRWVVTAGQRTGTTGAVNLIMVRGIR
jgi:hypothetical protein